MRLLNRPGTLARLSNTIGMQEGKHWCYRFGGHRGDALVRDLTDYLTSEGALASLLEAVKAVDGIEMIDGEDRTFLMHKGGKIEVLSRMKVLTREQLSMAYTPGVACVCTAIHRSPEKVYDLTMKGNMVAVVTNGTAVLGLGDIGPAAALPVMEGKAQLFKEFAGVNVLPTIWRTWRKSLSSLPCLTPIPRSPRRRRTVKSR